MAKFELKQVNELPKRRLRREPMYDEIISKFLQNDMKYAEVSVENKKPATVLSALRKRAKDKGITVRSLGGKVYLERT